MSSKNLFETYNQKKIYTHSKNDYISNSIATFKCWEPNISFFIDKKFNNSTVFFDVGANIGYYSIVFNDKFKHVYSFEPNPDNTEKLIDSIKINKINNVTVVKKAVGKISNIKYTAFNKNNVSGSNIGGIQYVKTEDGKINSISLDDFIEEEKIKFVDLLKIDIEGGELDCLLGTANSIGKGIIRNIIIEVTPKFSMEDSKRMLKFLSHKYEFYNLGLNERGFYNNAKLKITKVLDLERFLDRVKVQTNLFCKLKENQ